MVIDISFIFKCRLGLLLCKIFIFLTFPSFSKTKSTPKITLVGDVEIWEKRVTIYPHLWGVLNYSVSTTSF